MSTSEQVTQVMEHVYQYGHDDADSMAYEIIDVIEWLVDLENQRKVANRIAKTVGRSASYPMGTTKRLKQYFGLAY